MVAVDVLREGGFEVDEVGTAAEALERMSKDGNFAAAILDFGLPDRRADELALELRALHAELPLVIASGYDEFGNAGPFRRAGPHSVCDQALPERGAGQRPANPRRHGQPTAVSLR